jgi:hypothetical protein
MSIQIRLDCQENILKVTATGYDESVADVLGYGRAVIEAALAHGCRKILCDETNLAYHLKTLDIYEAAATIAREAPDVARVAIVCNPVYWQDAKFWENVASNRGLIVRMFGSLPDAENWLSL